MQMLPIFCAALVAGSAPSAGNREPHDPLRAGELPQYVFFNKIPGHGGPHGWHQAHPEKFTPESVKEVIDALGTPGAPTLRFGVHFPFSILENKPELIAQSLRNLLRAAEEVDVPVLVTLDGQNWWESRPDLWNWWDPALPGFDRANARNVEWTGWGPQHAVKIGWRNWGRQIRVRPAPNIASARVLAAHWKAYDVLIPVLLDWQRALPADRKYLFGGLKVGWEASINVNAYHHRDGNRIFEASPSDASKDPDARDAEAGWDFGNATLGYAAVATEGIRRSGTLRKEDIEEAVARYLRKLCAYAVKRGVPRHLLFTHQGGTFAPWEKHLSFRPAINDDSIPGWSFYSHDPAESGSLAADLEAAGRTQWAASEWWRGGATPADWRARFEAALRFKQCRFICVYNWEPFRASPEALEGARALVRATSRPAQ